MQIIPRMAAALHALQDLLTVTATEIGTQCPLIKRQREFTASSLLATFVLGFLQRPKPTWDHLALIARQLGANVTPQAVLQRVTPVLADALAQLWQAAVGCVVTATPRATPLLAKFTQVLIGDSTTIRLADEMASQFPGCGGSHGFGRAALKLQVIWDYLSGQLCRMRCEAGKQNDSTSPVMDETPAAGSLSIFDLGYFSLERFAGWQAAGAHWISRGISDLLVWTDNASRDLHEWLQTQPAGPIDRWVEVGEARLRCRIVALRAAGSRRATASKGVRQGRQERPATDRQTSGHLRLDRVSHVVCRRPVDLAGSRRLVSRSLADRTVVQVVEVARLDRRTSLGRPRAATGRTLRQTDRRDRSTLVDPGRLLVRRPRQLDEGFATATRPTAATDRRAGRFRTTRGHANPLGRHPPRPSPPRHETLPTQQPPTPRKPGTAQLLRLT